MKASHVLMAMIAAAVAAPAAAAEAPASKDPRDRRICKSFQEIGSLVKRKRICKTLAQWDADRALLRQQVGVNSCVRQPCEPGGK